MTAGQRIITGYFLIFYLAPAIGNVVFSEKVLTIYKTEPLSFKAAVTLIGTYFLFLLLSHGPRYRIFPQSLLLFLRGRLEWIGGFYLRFRSFVAVLALTLAVPYALSGLSGYRYAAEGLSEINSIFALVIIVFNAVITIDLFYWMFVRSSELKLLTRQRLENILLSISLILTANGTASMLMSVISFGYSLSPAWFTHAVFAEKKLPVSKKIRHTLIPLSILVLVFSVSWVAGEIIKLTSGDRASGDFVGASQMQLASIDEKSDFYANYGYYLISATSSYYYSLLYTAHTSLDQLAGGLSSAILHPLQSLAYRMDYLVGGLLHVERPEYGSLSRLNYVLLTDEPIISLRAGTSPGPIASFNYVFPTPFNIVFCAVYLCWLSRLFDRLLYAHQYQALTIVGLLILLNYMLPFFQSIFDLLIIFDNSDLYILLIACIAQVAARGPVNMATVVVSK